ncbi:MAG: hypothetical protein ACFFB0_17980 [Promethearchaeota archaeon]
MNTPQSHKIYSNNLISQKKEANNFIENRSNVLQKASVHDKFKSLLKFETFKILLNIRNYDNSLECKMCHKKIMNTRKPNYFHLYTEDQAHFITFHFFCALKSNTADEFLEIADNFDYTYRINNIVKKT